MRCRQYTFVIVLQVVFEACSAQFHLGPQYPRGYYTPRRLLARHRMSADQMVQQSAPQAAVVPAEPSSLQLALAQSFTGGHLPYGTPSMLYVTPEPSYGTLGDTAMGTVRMEVYRGPTMKAGHHHYAPWGYYVWQPTGPDPKYKTYGQF